MHRYWDLGFGPMHGFGWIFMVLFWVAVIVLIVFLVRQTMSEKNNEEKGKSALDLLNERYARGEIDKPTYDQMKHDLLN